MHVPEAVHPWFRPADGAAQVLTAAAAAAVARVVEHVLGRAVRHDDVDALRHGRGRRGGVGGLGGRCRRRIEAVFGGRVLEGGGAELRCVGRRVDGERGAVGEGEGVRSFGEVGHALCGCVLLDGFCGGGVCGGCAAEREVVGLVERDFVVAGDDEPELCGDGG